MKSISTLTRHLYLAGAIATNNASPNINIDFPTTAYSELSYFQEETAQSGFFPFLAMFDINGIPVSVGSSNFKHNVIKIYPNPTNGSVIVDPNMNTAYRIEMYDVFGKKLYSRDNNRGSIQINMTQYSPGIYIVTIVSSGETYSAKLIKQ